MPYVVPSGWIERLDDPTDALTSIRFRFHVRRDCPKIREAAERPTPAERPGTAALCPTCARPR